MKIAKGRRLKRYLGLIRESTPRIIGGIEVVTPGMITGWLLGKVVIFMRLGF